jgi:predicted O-linked N-acetylglucosamine transferase (SPINDLY family)
MVTLQGGNFAYRMSSSILRAIGLSVLVVGILEEYEALAVQLACSPGEMQTIRQRLSKHRLTDFFFDTSRFVRNLETTYKEMWGISINGQRPRQIEVIESRT